MSEETGRKVAKMPLWKKICKCIIGFFDRITNFVALVLIVSIIFFAGYSLWDAGQIYRAAERSAYTAYIPTEEDTRSFDELRAINPEVIGWLRVNDTEINYPLVQAEDNSKYVNTDAEGNYSVSGAIFLHSGNHPDFSDFNHIIYGHHMEKRKMFGDLGLFVEKPFFEGHPYGNLFFDGKDHGIEFFAFMMVEAHDDIFTLVKSDKQSNGDGKERQKEYLDDIYKNAMYVRDLDVTVDDKLILLSTCTSDMTNGRHVLVGRLSDQIYPEEEKAMNTGTGVDKWKGVFEKIPLWIWILSAVFLLFILYIVILQLRKKKKRRGKK